MSYLAVILLFFALATTPPPAPGCQSIHYALSPDCLRDANETACRFDPSRPDYGPQIAIWVESADRSRFVDTLMVTNATALFGIGNRPGASDLPSGTKFPYGRRPMALPIWAHARGKTYPMVVMQNGQETELGMHEGDSSPEPHFCRPMVPFEMVDAITCASGEFRDDKGILDSKNISVYPPRADLFDLGTVCGTLINHPNGSCSPGDSEQYAFLNDVDVVAAATPAAGVTAAGQWTVPASLPPGDYALMVEVGKEYDTNAFYDLPNFSGADPSTFPPSGTSYGTPHNFGQPSVVFRVPFTLGAASAPMGSATSSIYGYGDPKGDSGQISAPDGTVNATPGSGEGRLAVSDGPGGLGRVHLSLSACAPLDCSKATAPMPVPIEVDSATVTSTSASIRIDDVSDEGAPVLSYDLRYTPEGGASAKLSPSDFVHWTPAPQVLPNTPGSKTEVTLQELRPGTNYAVGVTARGRCGNSVVTFARFKTPPMKYAQLKGCFIATAAFDSDLAPEIDVLRRLRDLATKRSGLASLAADLYYRAAPAAARPLVMTAAGRAVVRVVLRPVVALGAVALQLANSDP